MKLPKGANFKFQISNITKSDNLVALVGTEIYLIYPENAVSIVLYCDNFTYTTVIRDISIITFPPSCSKIDDTPVSIERNSS